jgi:hypothetical protein
MRVINMRGRMAVTIASQGVTKGFLNANFFVGTRV